MENNFNLSFYGELSSIDCLNTLNNFSDFAVRACLMADHHSSKGMPVGTVLASDHYIPIIGIGSDIACGIRSVLTNLKFADIRERLDEIAGEIEFSIQFGIENKKKLHELDKLFSPENWSDPWSSGLFNLAKKQIGTIGAGNHFVDVFVDQYERIWIAAHFGSRGVGHGIANYFIERLISKNSISAQYGMLDTRTDLGVQYIKAIELAGQFASLGRKYVCQQVLDILRAKEVCYRDVHHNYAWKENHYLDGVFKDVWISRKGANKILPGEKLFVGGSMREPGYIIQGLDGYDLVNSLFSTVHGSGRILGRSDLDLELSTKSKLLKNLNMDVKIIGGSKFEEPCFYKSIDDVLLNHTKGIKIINKLTPIIVAMAPEGTYDPY